MSAAENYTANNGAYLASEAPGLLGSIATAMDLLEAAGGLVLLREILESESPEFKHATQELMTFLCLARVGTADAISIVEAEDDDN